MIAMALYEFNDKRKGVRRYAGDEFTIAKDRFDEINANAEAQGLGPALKEVVKEPAKKPVRRKAAK